MACLGVTGVTRPVAAQTLPVPLRGDATAPIVIMVFSDFQCPSCAQLETMLADVGREFPKDVQIVFKHNPLAIHAQAPLAHEAAIEAGRQGRFWEMHDLLLANQGKLGREDLLTYARQLKLDVAAFTRALDTRLHRPSVERDRAEARALGIESAPVLFINGRRGQGVPPATQFKAFIKSLASGGDGTPEPPPVSPSSFDLTGSPAKGADTAPVTIIEFSDFQCGFCQRANRTIAQLLAKYPEKVRLVFKHFPLEMHQEAGLAHRAAFAAQQQGRFWEMHDAIFGNQRAIARADLIQRASALKLDVARFTADMDGSRVKTILDRDMAEGEKAGIDGTPTFFVNGQRIVGSQPLEAFVDAVEKALTAKRVP